jgi:hypothetical protein
MFLVFLGALSSCTGFANDPVRQVLLEPETTYTQLHVAADQEMTLSTYLESGQVVQYRIWSLGNLAGIEANLRGPKGIIWTGSSLGTELRVDAVRVKNGGGHDLTIRWIQGNGVANYRYRILYDGPTPLLSTAKIQLTQARRSHQSTLFSENKVLVSGGSDNDGVPVASTEVVNTSDRTAEPAQDMEEARSYHSATAILGGPPERVGDVLICGGIGPHGDALLTTEIFDQETRSFEAGPLLPDKRAYLQAVYISAVGGLESFLKDKIVLVGGERTRNRPQFENLGQQHKYVEVDFNPTELWYYDPVSDTIQEFAKMKKGRLFPSVSYLPNGWLVIMGGGVDSTPSQPGCDVNDDTINCYCKSQEFPLCIQYLGKDGKDGFINYTFKDRATNTVEIYDTSTGNLFMLNSKMHRARLLHSASVLPGGRVLVAGGSTAARVSFKYSERKLAEFPQSIDSVEIFDPFANDSSGNPGVFYLISPLAFPREQHRSVVTKTGSALLLGGIYGVPGGLAPVGTIEIYPGPGGAVSAVDSMGVPRGAPAVTLLGDRMSVLITGGQGAEAPLDSAELLTFGEQP